MKDPLCRACRYWRSSADRDVGECHRYPPSLIEARVTLSGSKTTLTEFRQARPTTKGGDFCGEGEKSSFDRFIEKVEPMLDKIMGMRSREADLSKSVHSE